MIVRESISFERGKTPRDSMRIGRKARFKGMDPHEVAEDIYTTIDNDIEIDSLERQGEYALRKYEIEDWDDYFDMVDRGEDEIGPLDDILIKLEERIEELLSEGDFPIISGKEGNVYGTIFSMITQGGAIGSIVTSLASWIDEGYLTESVNFERGKDPREKMNIGDKGYRILKKLREIADSLGIEEVGVNDLNPNVAITSWKMPWLVGPVDKSGFGRIILFKPLKEEGFKVFSKGHRGSDIDQWQRWDSPRKWIENIKMLKESVNFERGGTDSQIRKRILGDPPGKIMREGGRTTFSVLMLLDDGKYREIGFFMRSPGSHKSGGGLKTFYFLPGDEWEWGEEHLSPLSKWEQNKIEKFFPEITKTFGISPYFGDKVNESISFERGKKPKEGLGIGLRAFYDNLKRGDMMRLKKDLPKLGYYKGYLFRINGKVSDSTTQDGTPSKWVNSKDVIDLDGKAVIGEESPWNFSFDFFKKHFIPVMNESVNFERGKDPRDTMKIGAKEKLKSDALGLQTGWTSLEKQRPSLLGLAEDPNDIYILGFAGEVDYGEWHFNEYTRMLYDACAKGQFINKKVYGDNTYTLKDTKFGKIVMAKLDEEGMYFYGGLDAALNIGIQDIPQSERESIF